MKYIILFVTIFSSLCINFSEFNNSYADAIFFDEKNIGINIKSINKLFVHVKNVKNCVPEKVELIIRNEMLFGAVFSYSNSIVSYKDLSDLIDNYCDNLCQKKAISDKFTTWRLDDSKIAISLSEEQDYENSTYNVLTYRSYN